MLINKKTLEFLKFFSPFFIIITGLCALLLITVQQSYRQSANDPQIQIAEDVAGLISGGQNPKYYIPQGKIDISKSMATYIMIFDKNAYLIGSSATIGSEVPKIPDGVFNSAQKLGETKITWQPKRNVRSAIVVKYYKGINEGFVIVGRSLREIEVREENLTKMVLAAYVLILLATSSCLYLLSKKK